MQISKDHLLSSYHFDLPSELIASRPIEGREHSKLLVYDVKSDTVKHLHFRDLPELLQADDLLVLNESKVFPCRLYGQKNSGGKCEIFFLSLLHDQGGYPCLIKSRGKKNKGDLFQSGELVCQIEEIIEDGSFKVSLNLDHEKFLSFLEESAHVPIPPYIRGGVADEKDKSDYQTVYAGTLGSVAAPTAGLHFTDDLFKRLEDKGIERTFVTLHVGAGTFKPVTTDRITDHTMHAESFTLTPETLTKLNTSGKRKIAVGTTSLRVLESSFSEGTFSLAEKERPWQSTDIFLYPGKEIQSIGGMITNFHLPGSSLIMLVSALIGREKTLELYDIAIQNRYRFFSYGDAMLILR